MTSEIEVHMILALKKKTTLLCSLKMLRITIISYLINVYQEYYFWGFPGGTVVKNLPANAGDTGSIPGPGRSHMPQSN